MASQGPADLVCGVLKIYKSNISTCTYVYNTIHIHTFKPPYRKNNTNRPFFLPLITRCWTVCPCLSTSGRCYLPPSTSVQRGQSCPVASAVCFQQRGHFSLVVGRTMTVYAASSRISGRTVCGNCSDQAHPPQLDQGSCSVTGPAVPQKQTCSDCTRSCSRPWGLPTQKTRSSASHHLLTFHIDNEGSSVCGHLIGLWAWLLGEQCGLRCHH